MVYDRDVRVVFKATDLIDAIETFTVGMMLSSTACTMVVHRKNGERTEQKSEIRRIIKGAKSENFLRSVLRSLVKDVVWVYALRSYMSMTITKSKWAYGWIPAIIEIRLLCSLSLHGYSSCAICKACITSAARS